jgi:chromosome segregation ATPase
MTDQKPLSDEEIEASREPGWTLSAFPRWRATVDALRTRVAELEAEVVEEREHMNAAQGMYNDAKAAQRKAEADLARVTEELERVKGELEIAWSDDPHAEIMRERDAAREERDRLAAVVEYRLVDAPAVLDAARALIDERDARIRAEARAETLEAAAQEAERIGGTRWGIRDAIRALGDGGEG